MKEEEEEEEEEEEQEQGIFTTDLVLAENKKSQIQPFKIKKSSCGFSTAFE